MQCVQDMQAGIYWQSVSWAVSVYEGFLGVELCKCFRLKQHLPAALNLPSPTVIALALHDSRSKSMSMVAGVVFSEVTRKQSHAALPLVAPTHPESPLSQVLMVPPLTPAPRAFFFQDLSLEFHLCQTCC